MAILNEAIVRQQINSIIATNYRKEISGDDANMVLNLIVDYLLQLFLQDPAFKGAWNASTNSPALTTTPSAANDFYTVTVAGTQSITGSSVAFAVGDTVRSNGAAWVRIPFAIADSTITPPKTTFFAPQKNKFNINATDNVLGQYIEPDGSINVIGTYNLTGYIPVLASTLYTTSIKNRIAFFDASKTYISGLSQDRTNTFFTTPSNAAYARFSVPTANWNNFQLELGGTITAWEAYALKIDSAALALLDASGLKDYAIVSTKIGTGAVTEIKIAPGAVTEQKTNFFQVGKNKFNINATDNVLGYYIESDGQVIANAGYNLTGYIPVLASTLYTTSIKNRLAFFDANMNYISGLTHIRTDTFFTTPSNAAYVRLSVGIASWNNFQLELGGTITAWEAYAIILKTSYISDNGITTAKIFPGAVTPAKTSFILVGKNKFNINAPDIALGYYVGSENGILSANASYNVTGFIPVLGNTLYTPSFKHQLAFFDVNYSYISGLPSARTDTFFTTPSNAAYVRLSVGIASWNNFQLELGGVATSFDPYYFGLDTSLLPIIQTANLKDLAITTAKLAERSVTESKLDILETGKNLFNPATAIQDNYIVAINGTLGANTSYVASDFIPVLPSTQYARSHEYQMAWYTSGYAYISGEGALGTGFIVTSPANAAFARLSVTKGTQAVFQFEKGAEKTSYQAYGQYLKSKHLPVSSTAQSTVLAVTPKYYVPRNREIVLYFENIAKVADYTSRTKITGMATIFGRGWKLQPTNLTAISASATAYDTDFSLSIQTKSFTIQPVDETLTTPKKGMNIGDSYTKRSTFINKLMASSAATGISYYGIRDSAAGHAVPTVRCEGRGGWAVSSYTTLNTTLFSPFMQPQDPYRYFGNTSFWISAKGTTNYDTEHFNASTLAMFNSFGYLVSPTTNDVVYDNTAAEYRTWNGSAWVAVTGLTFSFNFAKYRAAFGIPVLDFVHILLGTNDFASTVPSGFTTAYTAFKTGYDTMINSIKADMPSCKIFVGIPVSPGKIGRGVYDTEMKKMTFWMLAAQMATDYGNREGENIIAIDYHATVDRVYGYTQSTTNPGVDYATNTEIMVADTIHLGPEGFAQKGTGYWGAVQSIR